MKIAVVTGSRAEYGLLRPTIRALAADPTFDLTLIVTGSHLSPAHGLTVGEIEADGLAPMVRVPVLVSGDGGCAAAKSMGLVLIGFADVLADLAPDLMLVLGDRYEILAAVSAGLVARVPVGHLCGGDETEGAFDNAIRHAITKLAHVHFPMTAEAARRVCQMGEDPARVHVVGHPGLDELSDLGPIDREATQQALGFTWRPRNVLVTYHPETLADEELGHAGAEALLAALHDLGPDVGIIFTQPNADPGGERIAMMIEAFAAHHGNAAVFASLGRRRYLDVMRQVDAVVGNSSSGLLEAPSFSVPTVNIGDRQKGRPMAASVIATTAEGGAISKAILEAFALDCRGVINPYGTAGASARIRDALKAIQGTGLAHLLRKQFHAMPEIR